MIDKKREIKMIKKILAVIVLVMFICCGCGVKKQSDDVVSKLDEIMKREAKACTFSR